MECDSSIAMNGVVVPECWVSLRSLYTVTAVSGQTEVSMRRVLLDWALGHSPMMTKS